LAHGTPESILELVWSRITTGYYKENPDPSRFQNITKNMFWSKDDPMLDDDGQGLGKKVRFPCLKGKAAEVRALMPALEWAWQHTMDHNDDAHKEVLVALQCSVFLDTVLDEQRDMDAIPLEEADKFKNAGFAMMSCFTSVHQRFAAKGIALFNYTPKCHYLLHICLSAKWLNPRRCWCYAGEDFMRYVARLFNMSCKGSSADKAGVKMMEWYAYALGYALTDTTDLKVRE